MARLGAGLTLRLQPSMRSPGVHADAENDPGSPGWDSIGSPAVTALCQRSPATQRPSSAEQRARSVSVAGLGRRGGSPSVVCVSQCKLMLAVRNNVAGAALRDTRLGASILKTPTRRCNRILITDDISKNIQATQSHPMATKPHGDPKKSEAERANLMADKAPLEPDSFWCCCCWTGRLYYSKWL
ncbi:unnamed protein product [Lampetra fluviatilis]